jgi:hypothetical protein
VPSSPTRRTVRALVATALAAVTITAVVPAEAVPPPTWPADGHVPVGCTTATVSAGPTTAMLSFTDATLPAVPSITINGGTRVVVGLHGTSVTFAIPVLDTCSGVKGAAGWIVSPAHRGISIFATVDADPFHFVLGGTGTVKPSDAGSLRIPFIIASPRYSSFTLDQDFHLLTSTPFTTPSGDPVMLTGPWSTTTFYYLRQTTIATTQSAKTVKRKHSVTITATLSYADDNAWRRDNGETLLVQVRSGKSAWITKRSLVTSATGTAAYTFAPTATSQVRFVHSDVHSGRFTAASTSAATTVKIA